MTTEAQKPLKIFCSYSHKDEAYLNELRTWLRRLERQGLIEWWHDREISPGWEWEEAIDKNLRSADIILLLVTPDFMGSDYVFEKEIDRAVERHERGEARVIPIIVRPADWEGAALDRLQALPKDANPITTWPNRDEAWLDVARGIRKAVEELLVERQQRAAAKERYREAVEEAWADKKLSSEATERLDALASALGLGTDTAADIEREVMGDTIQAILERQEPTSRERERQDRLDGLYARARRSHQNQEWQAVVDIFEQIRAQDPQYPDPAGLLASAREALEIRERMQKVAALYDQGQQSVEADEWQQALERLEEVQRLEPGYVETEELLSRVRQELASPTSVAVPDLSGQKVYQASSMLANKGLRLRVQNEIPSDTVPEGQIMGQSPEAGMELEANSSVNITLSSGMQEEIAARPSDQSSPEAAQAEPSPSGGHVGRFNARVERVQPDNHAGMQPQPLLAALAEVWWVLLLGGIAAVIIGLIGLLFLPFAATSSYYSHLGEFDFYLVGFTGIKDSWPNLLPLFVILLLVVSGSAIMGFIKIKGSAGRWLLAEGIISGVAGLVVWVAYAVVRLSLGTPMWVIVTWAILTGIIRVIAAIRFRREIDNASLLVVSGALLAPFGVILLVGYLNHAPAELVLAPMACVIVSGAMLIAFTFSVRKRGAASTLGPSNIQSDT